MSKLWVDPPEGWKYGFPAIYDAETDGQMSEWIVRKGYPLLTIKEYGEQWHIRCWSAEEPEKYPDKDISAQKLLQDVKNAPIGTDLSKKTHRKVTVSQDDTSRTHTVEQLMDELAIACIAVRELGDRLAKLEKGKEPVAWNLKDVTDAYKLGAKSQQGTWVDLTKEECFELCVKHKDNSFSLLVAVQEKLMEKNT